MNQQGPTLPGRVIVGCRRCATSTPPGEPPPRSLRFMEMLNVIILEMPVNFTERLSGFQFPHGVLVDFLTLLRQGKDG